jgi:SAM-dependent methyltransferase
MMPSPREHELRPVQLFHGIDQINSLGLEIGALDKPAALRSVGRVYYADYASVAELRRNHAETPTVDKDNIVDVDFVTGGHPLSQVIPEDLCFDYVVASHVAEHVPDLISWLADLGQVVKPGGIVSLIIPNKEFTFDIKRTVSEEKDVFSSYVTQQTRPSPMQVFDHFRWYWRDGREVYSRSHALDQARRAMREYVDCHCWVFTPESFCCLAEAVAESGLVPFKLDLVTTTEPGEIDFFVRFIR